MGAPAAKPVMARMAIMVILDSCMIAAANSCSCQAIMPLDSKIDNSLEYDVAIRSRIYVSVVQNLKV